MTAIAAALTLAGAAAQASGTVADDAEVAAPVTPQTTRTGSYLAARAAEAMGDFGSAVDYMEDALRRDPDNPELLQRAFVLQLGEGRIEAAVESADRLKSVDGGPSSIGTFLAVEAIKKGDYAAAERFAAQVAPGGANRFVVPILKAWSRLGAKDLEGALRALSSLQNIDGFGTVYYVQRGLIYEIGGKLDEAEHDYAKALEISGNVPLRLVQLLGNLYARTGRADEARAIYHRFIDENPDTTLVDADLAALDDATPPPAAVRSTADGLAEAMLGLATILSREQADDIALLFVRLALDLRPDHLISQVLLGDILRDQKRFPEALAAYRAVPDDAPFNWAVRINIADCLDQMGRTDEAEALLRKMVDEAPARYDAALALGNLLRAKERFEQAGAAYDIALARIDTLEPRHWSLLYFRGIAYERSDQWPKAEADFKKALALEPDQPFVLNYLGDSWIEKGEHLDEALDMLAKAVKQRPNDGYIVDSLGWAYYRLGRYDDAVTELERAVGLKPLDPVLNDHLGDAYWRVGRKLEAGYQWRRALQFKPEADQVGLIQE
jgi:tetratricopeptide (TPR) repeat protein